MASQNNSENIHEFIDIIAAGYDWICTNFWCQEHNHLDACPAGVYPEIVCKKCKAKYIINGVNHAYE